MGPTALDYIFEWTVFSQLLKVPSVVPGADATVCDATLDWQGAGYASDMTVKEHDGKQHLRRWPTARSCILALRQIMRSKWRRRRH